MNFNVTMMGDWPEKHSMMSTFRSPTNALVDPPIPIRTLIDLKFILHEWCVIINSSVCVKRTVVDHCSLKATDANYKLHSCVQLVEGCVRVLHCLSVRQWRAL